MWSFSTTGQEGWKEEGCYSKGSKARGRFQLCNPHLPEASLAHHFQPHSHLPRHSGRPGHYHSANPKNNPFLLIKLPFLCTQIPFSTCSQLSRAPSTSTKLISPHMWSTWLSSQFEDQNPCTASSQPHRLLLAPKTPPELYGHRWNCILHMGCRAHRVRHCREQTKCFSNGSTTASMETFGKSQCLWPCGGWRKHSHHPRTQRSPPGYGTIHLHISSPGRTFL